MLVRLVSKGFRCIFVKKYNAIIGDEREKVKLLLLLLFFLPY